MKKVKVGVVGCGNISDIYLRRMGEFENVEVAACADLVREKAQAKAEQHQVAKACSVEELLADEGIEIVVNLTTPGAHAAVGLAAVEAGKSVYNEKPLAITREEGRRMLKLAEEKGLRIGGAPDTFLGGGHQTCRKLIDDGAIGEPIGATAFMVCHGHESWHPDPEFYYQAGGGPMFDMGPYYLTALVNMMGPVRRVTGSTRITFPERTITSEPKKGAVIRVETPTHIAGVLEFRSGAIGTLLTSFDVWAGKLPRIEVYGTKGSLEVPDPNGFGGPVEMLREGDADWQEVELSHGYAENTRGIGVAEMARCLGTSKAHRCNGELAYHVLDIMHAIHEAAERGEHVVLESTCARPEALPTGLKQGQIG